MKIGPYQLSGQVLLAPMAGITDLPFRILCRRYGAALATSEMVTSQADLWHSRKTQSRLVKDGEPGPISVQIAGTDPDMMAKAAAFNVTNGAQLIDINMGCPAKKVCNVAAGSALLKDEGRVKKILQAVVEEVDVPVTLKIRTGWDKHNRNAQNIAHIAEQQGIAALTIHGRTRACGYSGEAEYDLIKQIKNEVSIPIVANGDIDSVEKAKFVLQYTRADAVMVGRTAQKSPWIFRDINHYLQTGEKLLRPSLAEIQQITLELLKGMYQLYGDIHGVRVARKHLRTLVYPLPNGEKFWRQVNQLTDNQKQFQITKDFFASMIQNNE